MQFKYENGQSLAEGERVFFLDNGQAYVRTSLKALDPTALTATYNVKRVVISPINQQPAGRRQHQSDLHGEPMTTYLPDDTAPIDAVVYDPDPGDTVTFVKINGSTINWAINNPLLWR